MTRISVNINKIATIRNARGGNKPDLIKAAVKVQEFGAEGITVHPRPDERHIKYSDVFELKSVIKTEFNIEGYPNKKFISLIEEIRPDQVTLVPDSPDVLTSNSGWDTITHFSMLSEFVDHFKKMGVRTSLFIDPNIPYIEKAAETNTDRIELYTETYASGFEKGREQAILAFIKAGMTAAEIGLDVNAGHDLNLNNLNYFVTNVPGIKEVSIGHALISDALYLGLENAVKMYKNALVIHEAQL